MIYEQKDATLIDLSHTVEDGLITYQGLPAPVICDYWSRETSAAFYEEGVSFQIGKIEMVANTGTYLDAPFHRFAGGKDLSELFLSSLANLDGLLVHIADEIRAIGPEIFSELDVSGKAVLFRTDWDRHWGSDAYFTGHPFLTGPAARLLRDRGAALVGIDSTNIDDTADKSRPVHSILLEAEIPIVEHLTNLVALPETGFKLFAVPVKVKGMGTFPVRALAVVPRPGPVRKT